MAKKNVITFLICIAWYPILDVFRTKYYGIIVSIGKEVEAKHYLGVSPFLVLS